VRSETSQPLVLVVDDYEDARTICAEYLQFRGFRCATVGDGREALAKALELLPDVILMDLALPGLDGWEATRELKRDERTRDIPVIAITAFDSKEIFLRALEAGCIAVLAKPIAPRILEEEIRRILHQVGEVEP